MSTEKQSRTRKPRISVFVGGIIVCIALVVVLKMGRTASVDIPRISTKNLSPSRKTTIEKARHDLEAEESADTWGQYGMVLRAFDFNAEALRCFQTARSLDPKNPRWPYFINRILHADRPAEVPIVEQFEDEVTAIRNEAPK
jgi:hypothetical protein